MSMCMSMAASADYRCGSSRPMCGTCRRRLPRNWSPDRCALLLLLQQLEPTAQRFADMRAREPFGLVAVACGNGVDDHLMLAMAGRGASRDGEGGRAKQRDPVLQFP